MSYTYSIHPSIGVARVGNSETEFFLAPNQIGALPIECDEYGNEQSAPFNSFKDASGKIKRQAQKFRVYRKNSTTGTEEELTVTHADVASIEWTVHLANKKAAWYQFSEYKGNLLFGDANSYTNQNVELRNKDAANRQTLIIDPGPRTIAGTNESEDIDRSSIPSTYPHGNFPPESVTYGYPIDTLGTLKTDSSGRLLVLGGFGKSGGDLPLSSYGGADTWYDDISDGSVTCTITFSNGEPPQVLKAWAIVGPPDFAPQITNISSWDDTIFDLSVRHFNLVPEMYQGGTWNDNFQANYQRDILPIILRIAGYHWVANVQSMLAFSSNIFDFGDPSPDNEAHRQQYFAYFRVPEPPDPATFPESRQITLFSDDGLPLMPLNSGSNSVSNDNIEKFLSLTQTQYFLLKQWADGKFENTPTYESYAGVDDRDRASVGNVVGLPQCPGIEVTWTTQNPIVYESPYHIAWHQDDYTDTGLSPSRDECNGGGCEPGDLTKRMAIPWQADFFNCSIQFVNFTDPNVNKEENAEGQMVPKPPTYYSYWWPPQAPWNVLSNDRTASEQDISGVPAGLQVNFIRGVNSYKQMVNNGWSYLAFIRNQNTGSSAQLFPYIVETERNNTMFAYESVPISDITNRPDDDGTDVLVFYLKTLEQQKEVRRSQLRSLGLAAELDMFKEIEVVEDERQRIPRSGTRIRF
ncbi:CTQ-dependent lysine 6-oxidase LodA [Baaleninema simplex]|uniref:CTQ-dependent lysine 6-oxidase LodA n=1 Tax=Baaleninema simplex TaxID=2862350 RepID=UPI00034C395D|nr:CTQ-dependent lysine 6-oxidase LodA [Baaleninema simplex]